MTLTSTIQQVQACSVRLFPRQPIRNLSESKCILAALQKRFGQVVTFRNEEYDTTVTARFRSNAIEAIFDSPQAAQTAIDASPIYVDMPPRRKPSFSPENANANANHSRPIDPPFALECDIKASDTLHWVPVKRNPFFQRFEQDVDSLVYKDLTDKLKRGLKGLADAPMAKKEALHVDERMRAHSAVNKLGGGSLMWLWELGVRMELEREIEELEEDKKEIERNMAMLGNHREKSSDMVELEKKIEELKMKKETSKRLSKNERERRKTETEMEGEKQRDG
ncbi:hypothetical protein BJX76DRAFT_184199 [Aspergillus varians]